MKRIAVILGTCAASEEGGPRILPPSDQAAVALALHRLGGRVEAYTPQPDETAWRYALAAGASTASLLADLATPEFDVLLIGRGGTGPWGDLLPADLAERARCALVLDALDVTPIGNELRVVRNLGRGNQEVLHVAGPAVLAVSDDAPRLLYVSRFRRRAVEAARLRTPPSGLADPAAADSGPWTPVRPRARTGNLAARTAGPAADRMNALFGLMDAETSSGKEQNVVVADARTCAQHLARYLSHHGLVRGGGPVQTPGTAPASPPATPPAASEARPAGGGPDSLKVSADRRHQRGPRGLESPAGRDTRRPTALSGPARQPERCPVPVKPAGDTTHTAAVSPAKLSRAPRSLGQAATHRVRGPFPVPIVPEKRR
ncbi:MAG: hypothetical protein HYU36_25480 [Planctomycetes bacterium]|nr:hypothetical protein [Planctomycetota bacterium]